ncbi:MAG: DUF423 domain-containing protein [Gemmatimonadota bacterium]
MTTDRLARLGAVSAALAVIAGAFGAHALKDSLSAGELAAYETGARYQMYHALGLFIVAWTHSRAPTRATVAAGWCFIAGTVLFSGSLYALAILHQSWLGAITPLGGASFIAGWLCLAFRSAALHPAPHPH